MKDKNSKSLDTTGQDLKCDGCGYSLAGLTIESSIVTCPECSSKQTLVAWTPVLKKKIDSNRRIIWMCITVFLIVVALVLALVLIGVISAMMM